MTEPTSSQPSYPQQPPPPGPYPPPGYYPYQPPPPFNTYAILALVLAVFVLPPLGIYFGYKAKQQIAVTGERGVEFATAGVVIGWIFSAFYVVFCGFFAIMMTISIAAAQ